MLGFSYDWDRELATTDVAYFRWTQRIFLVLFDTWFDAAAQRGRPIAELPIPADVTAAGEAAVERYQDEHRLAYQLECRSTGARRWAPCWPTRKSPAESANAAAIRSSESPCAQWMLRITAYADRLERDLDQLDWAEGIKMLQRNWIGRSTARKWISL